MATNLSTLRILESHRRHAPRGEAPENVRVFSDGEFLFASFDQGREQVLDVRAHDRLELLQIYLDWYLAERPDIDPRLFKPRLRERSRSRRSVSRSVNARPPKVSSVG